MPYRRGVGRATAVAVALIALVALTTACQNWSQFLGNPGLTGEAPGETTITAANVASLTPAFSIPVAADVAGQSAPTVSGGKLFATTGFQMVVADAFGKTGCSGSPVVCQPMWTADLPGGPYGFASQPLVAGNRVYVTSSRPTGYGRLFVFDANGGTNCGGAPKTCLPLWTATVNSFAGPTVVGGVLYVNDDDTHQLQAFDADGATNCGGAPKVCVPLWSAAAWSDSAPSVANGRVYIATRFGSPQILAYDAAGSTGCGGTPKACAPLFTVTLPDFTHGSVAVSGSTAFVQTRLGALVAADANGACPGSPAVCTPLWTTAAPGTNWAGATTPAVSGGRVYVLVPNGAATTVLAYDAAGVNGCDITTKVCSPVWSSGARTRSFGNLTSPQLAGGLVWVLGQAWNPNGDPACPTPSNCPLAWTAPQANPSAMTVAYGTAYVRSGTYEPSASIVAYHLS